MNSEYVHFEGGDKDLDQFLGQYFSEESTSLVHHNMSLLKDVQKRDKLKKELCEKHNIKVYYYANYHYDFPYYVYEDKNILIDDIKLRNIN